MTRLKVLIFSFIYFFSNICFGQNAIKYLTTGTSSFLNNVSLTASAPARTFTYANGTVNGLGLVIMQVSFTRSTATAVTATCTGTIDPVGTPDSLLTRASFQTVIVEEGTGTSYNSVLTKPVAASGAWFWRIDAQGSNDIQCVFSATGASAGDTITVKAKISAF